jgi:hypothetical protein
MNDDNAENLHIRKMVIAINTSQSQLSAISKYTLSSVVNREIGCFYPPCALIAAVVFKMMQYG